MAQKECTLDFEIIENCDSGKERDIESETHSVLLLEALILSEIADPAPAPGVGSRGNHIPLANDCL